MFAESRARFAFAPGGLSLKPLLLGWAVSEIIAFALVVRVLGFGGAVLLSLAASVLGLIILRRIGTEATRRLRAALTGGAPPEGALLDGVLEGLGALLLILPGFVSDLAGLALASPSIRAQLAGRLGQKAMPQAGGRPVPKPSSDIIDLSPSDWRVVDRTEPR
jgi:UPF0716 protein FxsA